MAALFFLPGIFPSCSFPPRPATPRPLPRSDSPGRYHCPSLPAISLAPPRPAAPRPFPKVILRGDTTAPPFPQSPLPRRALAPRAPFLKVIPRCDTTAPSRNPPCSPVPCPSPGPCPSPKQLPWRPHSHAPTDNPRHIALPPCPPTIPIPAAPAPLPFHSGPHGEPRRPPCPPCFPPPIFPIWKNGPTPHPQTQKKGAVPGRTAPFFGPKQACQRILTGFFGHFQVFLLDFSRPLP